MRTTDRVKYVIETKATWSGRTIYGVEERCFFGLLREEIGRFETFGEAEAFVFSKVRGSWKYTATGKRVG